jgi:hypothetical protein
MELRDGITIKGRLSVTTFDLDGNVVDHREGDNVVCTNGLTAMAAAMVWSGIEDVAGDLGVTSPTYLTPLYGAIGTGTGTVAASDTTLFTEYARIQPGAGASVPATPSLNAQVTWQFYFAQPTVTQTITEAGVFALATETVDSGTLMDHWAFSPTVSFTTSNTLLLQVSFSIAGA